MIEDGVELLIGERIGDVLNECKSRKEAHFREEQKLLVQLDRKMCIRDRTNGLGIRTPQDII